MSDEEYNKLEKRVADGKKFLDGKWNSLDRDIQEWIRLWKQLGDELFKQQVARGVFKKVPTHAEVMASAEARIERVRQQMIEKGLLRKPKERRVKKSATIQSNDYQLFASS